MPSELSCRDIVDEVLDEGAIISLAHRAHIDRCPPCRDDLRSQRALLEALRSLRRESVLVPGDLVESIRDRLDGPSRLPRRLARAARVAPYLGGVVAATAAGAVFAVGRRRARFGLA